MDWVLAFLVNQSWHYVLCTVMGISEFWIEYRLLKWYGCVFFSPVGGRMLPTSSGLVLRLRESGTCSVHLQKSKWKPISLT